MCREYYKKSVFSEQEKLKRIVACSAGNHAQGVALASQKLEIKATERIWTEIKIIDGFYDESVITCHDTIALELLNQIETINRSFKNHCRKRSKR